jgi:uncharacterized protein YqeY
MLISDIKKFEIDERVEADDAKISNLINKNVKQRRDSIEQFKNGGRDDLVATEQSPARCNPKVLTKAIIRRRNPVAHPRWNCSSLSRGHARYGQADGSS